MKSIALAIIATLFILAAPSASAAPSHAPPHRHGHAPVSKLAPCNEEDGSGRQKFPCLWDATVRGNRKGTSYVLSAPYETARTSWDIESDAIDLEMWDAADELAATIRAIPVSKRTPAMKAALLHFEQNER